MITNEVSIFINRPLEQVFEYTVDGHNLHNWQSGFFEHEILTEGPKRVGTRVREVRQVGPRKAEIQGEVTAFESNKRFATKTLTKPYVTVDYAFESENGGTRIHYKFTLVTSGFMRLMELMIARGIKSDTQKDFEKLKSILETKTA